MSVYYNEIDPYCCGWLANLMAAGLIPRGDIDDRDIREVTADDVRLYDQCHFFAGIGGWAYALRLARWPDDRPVWTGSCPCPPFSVAGRKKRCPLCGGRPVAHPGRTGCFACCECLHVWEADKRHLWPEFRRLIAGAQPPVVFGEQVAGADGQVWLAGVRATLECCGYAFGASDIPAAGVGAPHIRQRLYWVGERLANSESLPQREPEHEIGSQPRQWTRGDAGRGGTGYQAVGRLPNPNRPASQVWQVRAPGDGTLRHQGAAAHAGGDGDGDGGRLEHATVQGRIPPTHPGLCGTEESPRPRDEEPERRGSSIGGLGDTDDSERGAIGPCRDEHHRAATGREQIHGDAEAPGRSAGGLGDDSPLLRGEPPAGELQEHDSPQGTGFWDDWELIGPDPQGRYRRIRSGTSLLVAGLPARVPAMSAIGNAICPPLAAEFIASWLDTLLNTRPDTLVDRGLL